MDHEQRHGRVLFPTTIYRDMRQVKRDLYTKDYGIMDQLRELKSSVRATFWMAFATFSAIVLGFGGLVLRLWSLHA